MVGAASSRLVINTNPPRANDPAATQSSPPAQPPADSSSQPLASPVRHDRDSYADPASPPVATSPASDTDSSGRSTKQALDEADTILRGPPTNRPSEGGGPASATQEYNPDD